MDIKYETEQAHRLEEAENWAGALQLYTAVAREREAQKNPDPALYNRVGDLHIRLEDVEAAVKVWERAIETYLVKGLSDSALAVCRKIVRYSPEREEIYLRMGQIRARQGLLIYARKHFLTYAEMVGMRGDVQEAIRAMEELVSWVPSDIETRIFLADRLMGEGRREKALVYLREGYWRALWEKDREAMETLRPRILELDPGADLGHLPEEGAESGAPPDGEGARRSSPGTTRGPAGSRTKESQEAEGGVWARILGEELRRREEAGRASRAVARTSPAPASETEEEVEPAEEVEPVEETTAGAPGSARTVAPEEGAQEEAGEAAPAAGTSMGLGDFLLDGSRGRTREGREGAADFTRLLSQFKDRAASPPDEKEARAQYEMGVANREMGMVDDAISLFQKALEIHPDFLPAYEMLGRCHLEKGEPEAALRGMEPALQLPVQVEDDLLGIYYYTGRAHEDAGRPGEAREWYDRIFSLDINFLDVTDRLRSLR